MKPSILFILVCYHNEKEVVSFVGSELGRQKLQDYHCMLVDNGSIQPELLTQIADNVKIFSCRPETNLGYFGGAAFGLRQYMKLSGNNQVPYLVVCNTDLHFNGDDFLDALYARCLQGGFDLLGPDVLSALTGKHQNPYIMNRISKTRIIFFKKITATYWLYNSFLVLYYLFKQFKKDVIPPKGKYYSLHGSFLVFAESFFIKGGDLDYSSFLFGEEIFLGEIGRTKAMDVVYDPDIQIIHKEHETTGIFKKKLYVKYLHESYKYILEKYYQ